MRRAAYVPLFARVICYCRLLAVAIRRASVGFVISIVDVLFTIWWNISLVNDAAKACMISLPKSLTCNDMIRLLIVVGATT
jgi:hypothetical protein